MTKLTFYTLTPGKHVGSIACPDNHGIIIQATINEARYTEPDGNLALITEDNCHLFQLCKEDYDG